MAARKRVQEFKSAEAFKSALACYCWAWVYGYQNPEDPKTWPPQRDKYASESTWIDARLAWQNAGKRTDRLWLRNVVSALEDLIDPYEVADRELIVDAISLRKRIGMILLSRIKDRASGKSKGGLGSYHYELKQIAKALSYLRKPALVPSDLTVLVEHVRMLKGRGQKVSVRAIAMASVLAFGAPLLGKSEWFFPVALKKIDNAVRQAMKRHKQ
jgi:hypothetical protein